MIIKNQSRSRNWNWKLVENMCNQTSPMQSISLNSQLQLRNSWECVNVGLYFNLTLSPAEQHLLQTPQWCPLRCFPPGRGGFVWSLPPSAWPCLPFFILPLLFYTFVWKTAGFPSLLAPPGCAAEHVWRGESLHFSRLRVFSLGGNLLSSVSLDRAASLIMLKEHLAAPRVLAGVPHCTNPWRGHCPSAYSWCPGWGSAGG